MKPHGHIDPHAAGCWHRAALLVALLFAVSMSACGGEGERTAAPASTPLGVTTVVVAKESRPEIYVATGTVRSRMQASVAAQVMGAVRELHVDAGDKVESGTLLARLDDRDLRAEYERAKADFQRARALLAKQALTRAEFDAVESRFRIAEAGLSYTEIRAPFAGVVAAKLCDVGDMATPGKQLFTIERTDAFRIETPIPERLVERVSVGDAAEVTIDASQRQCSGTVGEVVPAVDPATRSFLVKVDLTCADGVRSGAFARVRLQVGQHTAVSVPSTAVHRRGQLTYVFVARGGRAEMRLIKPGSVDGDALEVLAGLDPGETVIVEADGVLADGIPVRAHEARGPAAGSGGNARGR